MSPTRFVLPLLLAVLAGSAFGQQAHSYDADRKMTRVLLFQEDDKGFAIPAQYSFQYGSAEWKEEHGALVGKAKAGDRFRFGKDAWATLDTNRPLTIGGVKVAAGIYYLAFEKAGDDKMNLVLLDAAAMRKDLKDPFQADKITGGTAIPLKWEKTDKSEDDLTVKVMTSKESFKNGTLGILWGPHKLTAPVVIEM
jgi:hypothetical protein